MKYGMRQIRPLKLNNEFPITRVCYFLKMSDTFIIFIEMFIISVLTFTLLYQLFNCQRISRIPLMISAGYPNIRSIASGK